MTRLQNVSHPYFLWKNVTFLKTIGLFSALDIFRLLVTLSVFMHQTQEYHHEMEIRASDLGSASDCVIDVRAQVLFYTERQDQSGTARILGVESLKYNRL